MIASVIALAVIATLLIGLAPHLLARAGWVSREPRAALVLWQAIGLASGLALVGCAFVIALAPLDSRLPAAIAQWLAAFSGGDLTGGLGWAHLVLLVLAVGLFSWLLMMTAARGWQIWRARCRHRELVDLVGLPRATAETEILVLENDRVAVYCLPGMASRVVVTSAALQALDEAELDAVLAHERAHLVERHDLLVLPFIAWAAAWPMVGTAGVARRAVADLVEFVADDRACVGRERLVLATALARCGVAAGGGVPHGAFAARGGAVIQRVQRLLAPAAPARYIRWPARLAAALIVIAPVASVFLTV